MLKDKTSNTFFIIVKQITFKDQTQQWIDPCLILSVLPKQDGFFQCVIDFCINKLNWLTE